jgi:hypothetical protein
VDWRDGGDLEIKRADVETQPLETSVSSRIISDGA